MLPFHYPAELAHRICWLDHISGGGLMAGIGASSTTLDLEMFDIDHRAGVHREMIAESISMMLRLWESEAPRGDPREVLDCSRSRRPIAPF
ncbi:hypothetical protein HMPREF3114_18385 [Stenotrophomonas sp. HMSC10F07]|nr:hypothetical protein HMPREF3114_18385 [Stenotrophomonas sp. HMSC10F07]